MSHIFKISMNYRKYGYDIRTVQELLGHKDVKTTMIYTPVIKKKEAEESKAPCRAGWIFIQKSIADFG
ncbi:MAG: Tyrosine recombinase XerC [Candidatus Methanoperedenaceae archaeon GB50]|nr:Tyrosine recombinase XerC [Candidatus Methanoperedenaceae archaeon GB50]CAD7778078.1 MAG: Tyrosine recombinase XerC [Candidatus Methanoperedenaceae archaeon GB50]